MILWDSPQTSSSFCPLGVFLGQCQPWWMEEEPEEMMGQGFPSRAGVEQRSVQYKFILKTHKNPGMTS